MKEHIQTGKRILENRIVQGIVGFASIGILTWGWSAYHSVNALPDSLDALNDKVAEVQEEQKAKSTADSLLFATEVAEVKEANEELEVKVRAVEDAQIEYNIKQGLIIEKLIKISDKLDED